MDAASFAAVHAPQLSACGFPESLYDALRHKLTHEARHARCSALRATPLTPRRRAGV
jgi:hypothetical protein